MAKLTDTLVAVRDRFRDRTARKTQQDVDIGSARQRRRNRRALRRYILALLIVVAAYSFLFHVFMAWEGQEHPWVTGLYWTLTTMTTLGLGDIVFESDAGRLVTSAALVSGMLLFFLILPFAFVRFFYAPWLQAYARPTSVHHLFIARWDDIAPALVDALEVHDIP